MTGLDYAGFALLIFVAGALSTYLFGKFWQAVVFVWLAVIDFLDKHPSEIEIRNLMQREMEREMDDANYLRTKLEKELRNTEKSREEWIEESGRLRKRLDESGRLDERLEEMAKLFQDERNECYDLCKQIGDLKGKNGRLWDRIRELEKQIYNQ
jgi:chromosome segregation ATPase